MKVKGRFLLVSMVLSLCFVMVGCATSPSGPGTAPVVNKVTVGADDKDATSLTHVPIITFNANSNSIYVGVDVSDPDADITKVSITIKQNGNVLMVNGNPAKVEGDFSTKGQSLYSGMLFRLNLGEATGSGYTVEVFFTDKKGNKSNVLSSDVFTLQK